MKKILALIAGILFLMVGVACAASNVTFEWDANSEADLAGYRLYQTQTPGVYTFGDGNQVASTLTGTETVTITGVPDGIYYWVATAYDTKGNESEPSNEVTANLDTLAPGAPQTVTITIIIKVQ